MRTLDIDLIGLPTFIVEVAPDGDMRFASLNKANEEATGMRSVDLVGRPLFDCMPRDVAQHITDRYRECVETRGRHEYDEMFDVPGHARWWRTTLNPVFDPNTGRVIKIVGVGVEITDRKILERNLTDAAFCDPLTGVANRRRLEIDVENAMSEAVYSNRGFGLVLIDLDGFKVINDTFGHRKGDDVLRHVASLLSLATRKHETVARIGGDEFALKVAASSELELMATVASLRRFLDRSMRVADIELHFGASIGSAIWAGDQTFADLLAVADAAMYMEKARRRLALAV